MGDHLTTGERGLLEDVEELTRERDAHARAAAFALEEQTRLAVELAATRQQLEDVEHERDELNEAIADAAALLLMFQAGEAAAAFEGADWPVSKETWDAALAWLARPVVIAARKARET